MFQEGLLVNSVYGTAKNGSLCEGNTLVIVSHAELDLRLTLFLLIFLSAC